MLNYNIATALILWPAFILFSYDVHRLALHFIATRKPVRDAVEWLKTYVAVHKVKLGLALFVMPYFLYAIYAMASSIPPVSKNTIANAVMAWPVILIVVHLSYRVLKRLSFKRPRLFVVVILFLPLLGTAVFPFDRWAVDRLALNFYLLASIVACGAVLLLYAWLRHKLSPRSRFFLRCLTVFTLLILAYVSRPACCAPKLRHATVWSSAEYCGCVCIQERRAKLGPREQDLQEKAERGDASAQYDLSLYYFENSYSEKDDQIGQEWCIKAAEQGYKNAQERLAAGTCGIVGDYSEQQTLRAKWQRVIDAPQESPSRPKH